MNGGLPTLLICGLFLALTALLLHSVFGLKAAYEAGGGARLRHRNRRMLRLVGCWQIVVGAFLISTGSWVNSVALIAMGILLFASARLLTDMSRVPGESPDLRDPKDVERWLREKPPEPPA